MEPGAAGPATVTRTRAPVETAAYECLPSTGSVECLLRPVLVSTRSFVRTLTLNRPERRNAVNREMLEQLRDELAASYLDDSVRVVVIAAVGDSFCAGVDLLEDTPPEGASEVLEFMRTTVNPIISGMRASDKPVVAAIRGPAVGFGMSLALAADIAIAARSSWFQLGFVNVGAALDGGSSLLVASHAGNARARGLALLGSRLDAELAEGWGLIWGVVDDELFEHQVDDMAAQLAKKPAQSMGLIKAQLTAVAESDLERALAKEASLQSVAFTSPDFRKALEHFATRPQHGDDSID